MTGKGRPGPECAISRFLNGIDPDTAALLEPQLDPSSGLGHGAVHRVLEAAGATVRYQTVATHRRGQCRCSVDA